LRVAITGATGFVGGRLLVAHLMRGDSVHILTRRPVIQPIQGCKVFLGDLTVPDSLRTDFLNGVDVLYHCAGSHGHPIEMQRVNVEGTKNLIELFCKTPSRWVQLSSVGVYGVPREKRVVNESSPLNPRNYYEHSKALAENLLVSAAEQYGFEYVITRPSIIYGPNNKSQVLNRIVKSICRGQFVFTGPRGASVNLVSIHNVVDGLIICGTHSAAAFRTYNISDYTTIEDLVYLIADMCEVERPYFRLPPWVLKSLVEISKMTALGPSLESKADFFLAQARYCTRRIEQELGYRGRVGFTEGLRELFLAHEAN
jgi:nucleoside-diphosphate-sugar epimerase